MNQRTPYYSYDIRLLKKTLESAIEASEAIKSPRVIHYAIKANSNPEILKLIASFGLGADCVSGGEIALALKAGFRACDIVYAGVGKRDEEIEYGLTSGIGCFNVESLEELSLIGDIASRLGTRAHIALRLNPDIRAHTDSNIATGISESKFGIDRDDIPQALDVIRRCPALDLSGLHFHIGSQILDMRDYAELCIFINDQQSWFKENGQDIRNINVGGGLGVDYVNPGLHPIPDFKAYFDTFAANLELLPHQSFHCELGRSLVAQCGSLMTRCLFVKEGRSRRFLIVDAGMNDLVRPAMYGARHQIENLTATEGEMTTYDVVGPICETTDRFASGIRLPLSRRGDLLAIRSAGAYGESMASTYNSRPLPGYETVE